MASLRDIRRRIRSVVNIKQITRAMEMVATTKLRRFQGRAQASRPFTEQIETIVGRLAAVAPEGSSPLIAPRQAEPGADDAKVAAAGANARKGAVGVVAVTSDRGLCGAYNTNLLSEVHRYLEDRGLEDRGSKRRPDPKELRLYVIGRKGSTYFAKRGYEIARIFSEPVLEKYTYQDARVAARFLTDDFRKGLVSEVHVFSTRFESMVTFKPRRAQWLPVVPASSVGEKGRAEIDAIIEPGPGFLLDRLVPKYLEMKLWNLLLEALTSEYASRRVSMKNATDAADEMRGNLQRTYNRVRQESITKQLLEIVGGAEALR